LASALGSHTLVEWEHGFTLWRVSAQRGWEPSSPDLTSGSITYQLCVIGQVTSPFQASVSPSVKKEIMVVPMFLGGCADQMR
jgi:hypothetical protein